MRWRTVSAAPAKRALRCAIFLPLPGFFPVPCIIISRRRKNCTAHLEVLHAAKEHGSVIVIEFHHRLSKKLRARMIATRDNYEKLFRDLVDAVPLRSGASRKYLRLSLIGEMA